VTVLKNMILVRAIAVWLLLIVAEILHGIVRGLVLVPRVGEFRSSQIGVFTGSIIILVLTWLFIRWIGAFRPAQLVAVGVLWLCLTLAFEFLFGHFVVGASWERLAADYNLLEGGVLPIGMAVLTLAPLIAGRWRGVAVHGRGREG
jgi:hypothetical protein